jgi:hypothetical protein
MINEEISGAIQLLYNELERLNNIQTELESAKKLTEQHTKDVNKIAADFSKNLTDLNILFRSNAEKIKNELDSAIKEFKNDVLVASDASKKENQNTLNHIKKEFTIKLSEFNIVKSDLYEIRTKFELNVKTLVDNILKIKDVTESQRNETDRLLTKIDKIDFDKKFDDLDTTVRGILQSVQNVQNSLLNFENNLKEFINNRSEKTASQIKAAEDNIKELKSVNEDLFKKNDVRVEYLIKVNKQQSILIYILISISVISIILQMIL